MNGSDIPILTTTITDLYTDVKSKNLSKTEWPHFLLTALTENSLRNPPGDIFAESSPLQMDMVGEEGAPVVGDQKGGAPGVEVREVYRSVVRVNARRSTSLMKALERIMRKWAIVSTYR